VHPSRNTREATLEGVQAITLELATDPTDEVGALVTELEQVLAAEYFAEVKRMYVRPHARGRGVAQAVLARIEAEARGAGLSVLRLETGVRQADSIRLYERWGFRKCTAFGAYAQMPAQAIVTSVFYEKPIGAWAP